MLFSIKVIISLVPLAIVLYLMLVKFKSTHYKLFNLTTNETIEVITDKKKAIDCLLNGETVLLDNHNLCRDVTRKVSKSGHLIHIHFDNVNGINLLILTKGANMFTKYAYKMENYQFRSDL